MKLPVSPSANSSRQAKWLLALCLASAPLAAIPAFPGAEGFGANSTGARGGSVYHVTNLLDSGAGSFRDAVSVANRTVVFDVGGIITLTSPVVVKNNITIAGQTAPGGGITLYGDRLSFSGANNTIVRYLRIREGIQGDSGSDAAGAASGNDMIFDHVSASWGRDETFSFSGTPSRITLQDCIIGQGLLIHSAGGLIQTDGGVSILRTLYIDNWMRNPKVKGVNDFRNNIVYNWGSGGGYIPAGDSAGQSFANVIGNYFVAGPNTGDQPSFKTGNANFHLYHAGNLEDLNRDGSLNGTAIGDDHFPTLDLVSTPFPHPAPALTLSAAEAHAYVLANAGASLHRDAADLTMIAELRSHGTLGAHISNEAEIGGIGTLPFGVASKDSDGDGMPDWWEEAAGTLPLVADNNGDLNGDGYSNLENYLNALAPAGVQRVSIDGLLNDTGSSSSDGITSDGTVVLRGTALPGATVSVARVDSGPIATVLADAAGQWTLDVSASIVPNRAQAFIATVLLNDNSPSVPSKAFVVRVDTLAAATPAITSISMSPMLQVQGTSEPGSLVRILVDGAQLGEVITDLLGNWSFLYTGSPLSATAHAFSSLAVDQAGNTGSASSPLVVNPSITAPVFTSITTDSGLSTSDQITNDATLIFNGTAPANTTVSLFRVGTGVIGSTTASTTGTWSFNYTGTSLPQGTHTFTASALLSGDSSPASAPFKITIDTTRPAITSLRRLSPNSAATTATSVVFRIVWAEPVSSVDLSDWTLTATGSATGTLSQLVAIDASTYDVTVTSVSGDGTLRLDRKANGTGIKDTAGNETSGAYTGGQTYSIRLQGSAVWLAEENLAAWSNTANWDTGTAPSGAGLTADFSTRDLSSDQSVLLDGPQTLGRLVVGDADTDSPARWTLTDAGNSSAQLTLDGNAPTIQVNAASTSSGDTVDVPAANALPFRMEASLAGTKGFIKTGVGTLAIARPSSLSGPLTITKGIVEVQEGGSFTPSSVSIATSQQLRISGGSFSTPGNVTWTSGTGTGILVSGGLASFQKIIPSNARNSWVKVTGGVLTATDISFQRSGDSEVQALAAGILISGGDSTVGNIGLGTADSWGAMSISGGRMTVTGALIAGWQKTATRGGVINLSAGELNCPSTEAGNGLVLARNPGGSLANTNNVGKLNISGGKARIGLLTLGYDATSSAGSATINLSAGELNLGSGGLVKNGSGSFVATVNLAGGTLGALADWSTNLPLQLTGAGDAVEVRCATPEGIATTITLNGVLAGPGGFTKTGAGTLVLGAANTFAGPVRIGQGSLLLAGSLAAGDDVILETGAQLGGYGALNRRVVLQAGAELSATQLSLSDLLVQGGLLRLDLSAGAAPLAISGALLADLGSSLHLQVTPPSVLAHGALHRLVNFATTDLDASRITISGAPEGYAFVPVLEGNSLSLRVVALPSITSANAANSTYGQSLDFTVTASNDPQSFSANGLAPGLSIDAQSGRISGVLGAAGEYDIQVSANNAAGTVSSLWHLSVAKAELPLSLVGLQHSYDGTPQPVVVETSNTPTTVHTTYNGLTQPPTLPGSYEVVATVQDPNYQGQLRDTLLITITATVNHAPNINGALDGSLQMLNPEYLTLNGSSWISGDVLLPGQPTIRLNGAPRFSGVVEQTGAATPAWHGVTLNGNALLRHLVTRVDAQAMPLVPSPAAPTGTRSVNLNKPSDSAGDYATVRDLTLNSGAGTVSVPPGNYGRITVNGASTLVLGIQNSDTPSLYSLQGLTLNGSSSLVIAGPVLLQLAGELTVNTSTRQGGSGALVIEIANAGLSLNGNGELRALVIAPNGTITLNGRSKLIGRIFADRLTINGQALLSEF